MEINNLPLKFIWKNKVPRIVKTTLKKKNEVGGIFFQDLILFQDLLWKCSNQDQVELLNETKKRVQKWTHTYMVK